MVDEKLVKELLDVLRAYDAEKDAAKADAKEHKERMDELMEDAQQIREKLENSGKPTLFDKAEGEDDDAEPEDEPQRMTGLDDAPSSTPEGEEAPPVPQGDLGDRAYEAGAQARREGKPESDCPYESDTFLGRSWINGWREVEDIEGLPEEGSAGS